MDWNNFFQWLIGVIGGAGLLLWLTKSLFKHLMNKDIEKFKYDLMLATESFKNGLAFKVEESKNLFDRDIEKYKNELLLKTEEFKNTLEKITIEHQIKYSKLHDKRSEVIALLYSEVAEIETILLEIPHIQNSDISRKELYQNNGKEHLSRFANIFSKNRIFFSIETCELIDNLLKGIKFAIVFNETKNMPLKQEKVDLKKENPFSLILVFITFLVLLSLSGKIMPEISKLKKQLENEFRKLLGVETSCNIEKMKELDNTEVPQLMPENKSNLPLEVKGGNDALNQK